MLRIPDTQMYPFEYFMSPEENYSYNLWKYQTSYPIISKTDHKKLENTDKRIKYILIPWVYKC